MSTSMRPWHDDPAPDGSTSWCSTSWSRPAARVVTGAPGALPDRTNGNPPYPQWKKNALTKPGDYLTDNTGFPQGD